MFSSSRTAAEILAPLLCSRAMSVMSTAVSSRSTATMTAAASATAASSRTPARVASPVTPAWPARLASATWSDRGSMTTICSASMPLARSTAMALRPFVP